tara:strand:+ start:1492 stop:1668 length:177 start_codon:yes stop_codon:yes gene_type:complete
MKKNYIVIKSEYLSELEDEVNQKIEEGYRPEGSVTVVHLQYAGEVFYQAMTLENKSNF